MPAQPPLDPAIPTVNLSPFLTCMAEGGGGAAAAAREASSRAIAAALQTTGFFRVANHGVPAELMTRALELSRDFFRRPHEEKLRWRAVEGSPAPLTAGYARQPESSPEKNEYLLLCPPELGFNVYPADPPHFREVLEALYGELDKLSSLVEGIVNECMGLPPNFLREHNRNQNSDFLAALRYFPVIADGEDDTGQLPHKDGNVLTFVFQDDVGGLEVQLKDGKWAPVAPEPGTLVVNIGEIVEVLSNNRFKSVLHRVVRRAVHRHSFAFFHGLDMAKWVEPLKQFTEKTGERPKYRGFLFGEYKKLRMRNKTHPPARIEDMFDVSHYAI